MAQVESIKVVEQLKKYLMNLLHVMQIEMVDIQEY